MTTISLGPLGHEVLVTFGDVFIRAGFSVHTLETRLTVLGKWLDAGNELSNAAVIVDGAVFVGPNMTPLAQVPGRVWIARGWPMTEALAIPISDDQLAAIESSRSGGYVELVYQLQGTIVGLPQAVHPSMTGEARHMILAHEWNQLLDQLGNEVGITIRVPCPLGEDVAAAPAKDRPSMTLAGKRLREARDRLRDGDFRGCVQLCRSVLDNTKLLDPSLGGAGPTVARDRSLDERWAAVYRDLFSVASAASHDDTVTTTFVWTRLDAEAVIAATAGLLARASRR
jgi:hypothetical protein